MQTISPKKTLFVVSMASCPCFVCLSSPCLNCYDITSTTKVFYVYTEISTCPILWSRHLWKLIQIDLRVEVNKAFWLFVLFWHFSFFSNFALFECRDFIFAINICPAKPQIRHLWDFFSTAWFVYIVKLRKYLFYVHWSIAIRDVPCELSTESQTWF